MDKNININMLLLERVVLLTDEILDLRKDIKELKERVVDNRINEQKKVRIVPMKINR